MSRGENSVSNPNDLINEIFSRLPTKSVARFSCLSKQWRVMLAHSYFKELFFTRSSLGCVSYSPSNEMVILTADFHMKLPKDAWTRYEKHAFGLVYLCGLMEMVIFNPSMGQLVYLPEQGRLSTSRNYLGFDPVTNRTDNSWEEICRPLNDLSTDGLREGKCINGILYYFATQNAGRSYLIVCFDARSEEFRFITYKDFIHGGDKTKMINYKGKLGVITLEYDYNPWDWDLSPRNQIVSGDVSVVGVIATGDVVLCMEDASKLLYVFYLNIERYTLQRVEFRTALNHEEAFEKCSSQVILSVDHVENLNFINMETRYDVTPIYKLMA
ncbi:hypothetical protein N665_0054s0007 [Sinapis alba]|nr:hypothetical protein N665_0054s0007 [Sinapis alba]